MVKRVILDEDAEGDDVFAIMLAAMHPDIKIEGVTIVTDNVDTDLAGVYALKVLEFIGYGKVPVALGARKPLFRPRVISWEKGGVGCPAPCVKCFEALPKPKGKVLQKHAVDFIIDTVTSSPREITIIPVGSLTNMALAILKEPRIVKDVKEIILMGGAALVPGNVTPAAEFNISCDPEAAKIVFNSGIPITMVGLDVAEKVILTLDDIEKTKFKRPEIKKFVYDTAYSCIYKAGKSGIVKPGLGFVMYDPLASGVAIDKSLVKTEHWYVDVETKGEITLAKTLPDVRGVIGKKPNTEVCVEVDAKRFIDLFLTTVSQ